MLIYNKDNYAESLFTIAFGVHLQRMLKSDYEPTSAAKPVEVLRETLSINHISNTSTLRKHTAKRKHQ